MTEQGRTQLNDAPELHAPAQFWLRRALPLRIAVLTPAAVLAIAIVAGLAGAPWWAGVGVGVLLCAPLVVGANGSSLAEKAGRRLRFATRTRRRTTPAPPEPPFDVPLPGGGTCGMRWENGTVVTMLRIESRPRAMTKFTPGVTITDNVIPLKILADSLQQFDVQLESIDVISHGSRAYGTGDIARIYNQVLGPLPATAFRSVWVVLRLNPMQCSEAVTRRGGGAGGVLKTSMVATRRVAKRLADHGVSAAILTAAEINAATIRLTEAHDPTAADEQWDSMESSPIRLASFAATADGFTNTGLTNLWTAPTLSTSLSIRLHRKVTDRGTRPEIGISAIARFNTLADAEVSAPPGFVSLPGRQRQALMATLPVHDPFADRSGLEHFAVSDALARIAIPTSGCGQLIGADRGGRAVALPLVGSSVREVSIAGTLHLAQQVIFRAIALGAKVIVHSDRAGAWMPMANAIGNPALLTVATPAIAGQQAGARQDYSVLVFDGVPAQPHPAEITSIRVSPLRSTPANADVTLRQHPDGGPRVLVETDSGRDELMMVATSDELRYIGESLTAPERTAGAHRQ